MVTPITNADIQSQCTTYHVFDRGLAYYDQGSVRNVIYHEQRNGYSAWIVGNDVYRVRVDFDKNNDIYSYECECKAFDQYPGACKHIVALLTHLKKKQENTLDVFPRPSHLQKERRTAQLIEAFQDLYETKKQTFHERQILNVEYILHLTGTQSFNDDGFVELEMKVGPKRTYVVKNIATFLESVKEEKPLKFTKLFTYHPTDFAFTNEDQQIIELLYDILRLEFEQSSYNIISSNDSKRHLTIPSFFLWSVLEKLENQNVTIQDHDHDRTFQQISTPSSDQLPLAFSLSRSQNQEYFLFDWENVFDITYLGSNYGVLFHNGDFYDLKEEEKQVLSLMNQQFLRVGRSQVWLSKEEMEDFSSVVLPKLSSVGEVEIESDVRDLVTVLPLRAKLYVDKLADRLTAKLSFHYGENEFYPLAESEIESDQFIVRDIEQEMYLLSFIEDIPFKYNGQDLYLDDIDEVIEFVLNKLPILSEQMDVYTTSNVKNLVYEPIETPKVQIEANDEVNLLDVTFHIDDFDEGEMSSILKQLQASKTYYQLNSGAFLNLQDPAFDKWRDVLGVVEKSASEVAKETSLPMLQAFQLDDITDNKSSSFEKGRNFRKLIEQVRNPQEIEANVPDSMETVLRDYQRTGFQWLKTLSYYGFGGVLADDMGLGKTLQTIAFLASEKQEGRTGKSLIVCPSSLVYNWEKEIERFAPMLETVVISGHANTRRDALQALDSKDVIITSYPLLRRDIDWYLEEVFDTFILDEAQYVKNDWTKTAKSVQNIRTKRVFALSGTPIENSLDELYAIFDVVLPGLFPDKAMFKSLSHEEIAKRVRPFVLRRMKTEVLQELPDKLESVQYVELTDEQKQLYLGQLRLIQSEVKSAIETETFQENRMKILAGITRLRQICCHPNLFLDDYQGKSGKFERLLEYLQEAIQAGQKVVIFSQFTQMLSLIEEQCKQHEWEYHYLDGSTPSWKRVEMAERFNEGEKELFLVSLKAGGTGLNLIGGDTVILFDSWWNPAVEEQATDRVYRFGQKNVVQVLRLITTGTIEEKIHQLQENKRQLLEQVIQPGETMLSSLGKEEIEELLQLDQ
ncbi:DEAD/DEAH box helicase [Texcoconibacillus texcoconensis]|uniref:SNF2 family DNA or RNA helicase n=1 Tax=Texcoconibacillus texcoconensis TaxID=1095777 RepID=A0A840QQR0_9BACI|nr:DEAD/DEAH box helicase [Texcoconibacillus texcoconensis]MBB5173705.1 SNF2 family DNA or RNA helicase [Texcoconibacillus texcoconensis]